MTSPKVSKQVGSYQFVEYANSNYAVDYSNESVGYTIIFSSDKKEVEDKFKELTR